MEQLKQEMSKMAANGLTCSQANANKSVECYKKIYGPIKYTRA